jgi:hypothetical protein
MLSQIGPKISADAFNFALHMPPDCVKAQIQLVDK